MKAVVLAAGIGSRLGQLTKDTPKCLLPIGGRPLLDIWFERLSAAGVDEIFINLHHLRGKVESYLERRPYGLRITTLHEPILLGSAGTLRAAQSFIANDPQFFIIYADNLALVDLGALQAFHEARRDSLLTLLAYPTDRATECGILEFDANGRVIGFEEKPAHPRTHFANSGIHVASRKLFDCLPDFTPADIGYHVLPQLIGRMYGYVTNELILDIGTPETYAAAQAVALTK